MHYFVFFCQTCRKNEIVELENVCFPWMFHDICMLWEVIAKVCDKTTNAVFFIGFRKRYHTRSRVTFICLFCVLYIHEKEPNKKRAEHFSSVK